MKETSKCVYLLSLVVVEVRQYSVFSIQWIENKNNYYAKELVIGQSSSYVALSAQR
jgi:hypothetical protein